MLYVTRQKHFKSQCLVLFSPMNTEECVARRKYKTQVFLWKKKKKKTQQPPWTVLRSCQHMKLFIFQLKPSDLWLSQVWSWPSTRALFTSILLRCRMYEIMLKIPQRSRIKGSKSTSQQRSFFTRWKAKCLMRWYQGNNYLHTPVSSSSSSLPQRHTLSLLLVIKCVIKVKLQLLFMSTEHQLLRSHVKKKKKLKERHDSNLRRKFQLYCNKPPALELFHSSTSTQPPLLHLSNYYTNIWWTSFWVYVVYQKILSHNVLRIVCKCYNETRLQKL